MALVFDETANDSPAWVKDCIAQIALEQYDTAMMSARKSFEDACKKKDGMGRFNALHIIAKIHLGMGELIDAKEIADKAYYVLTKEAAVKGTPPKVEGAIKHTMAKIAVKLCKFSEAQQVAEDAMGKFSAAGAKAAEAAVLLTMASIHLVSQKKQEALKVAKQALAMFKEVNEKLGEANAAESIAKINASMRKFEDALRSANEILGIYQGGEDGAKEGAALLVVADMRTAMGEPDEAEEQAKKAVELFEGTMDKQLQAIGLRKLADACFAANNPTDGWTYVKEARELCMQVGNKRGEASALCQIAAAHINAGNFEEGGYIAGEALKLCHEGDFKHIQGTMLHALADGNMARINAGFGGGAEQHLNYQARKMGKEALAVFQDTGDLIGQAKCLNVLAMAFLSYGNVNEGKARAKAAVQLCQEAGDKLGEGINLLLVAQSRIYDNKDEALRLARLAEKLLKECGDVDSIKGAEDVIDFIRDFDKGGKKGKESKIKLSDIQSEKSDTVGDLEYGKIRACYFHGFTARQARAAR